MVQLEVVLIFIKFKIKDKADPKRSDQNMSGYFSKSYIFSIFTVNVVHIRIKSVFNCSKNAHIINIYNKYLLKMQLDLIFNKWRIFFLKNSGMNWKQKRYGIAVFTLWSSFNVKLIEISIFSFFFFCKKPFWMEKMKRSCTVCAMRLRYKTWY